MSSAPLPRRNGAEARAVRAKAPARAEREAVALEDLLTYQVCILAKLMDRASAAGLAGDRLAVAEWRVLAQLAARSPATVRGLAARLRVDRAEVSRAAAALIARRLVRRAVDPGDARSALFSPTESGRALYRAIMPRRVELNRRLLAALTEHEAAALKSACAKLVRLLEQEETVVPLPRARRNA
jgi:DNA-binding MarR family transcriptional regulator